MRGFAFTAALVLAGACAPDAPVCEPLFPDVPVVANARVRAEPEAVTWTELWRAGGLAEGQAFGMPVVPAVSPDHRVAIPDFQLAEVLLIGADGAWRGSIAQRGPGPGELSAPVGAAWSADGRLSVFDFARPAILEFGAAGGFERETPVDAALTAPIVARGELAWAGITRAQHLLVRLAVEPKGTDPSRGHEAVLILRGGTSAIDTLIAVEFPIVWSPQYHSWPVPGWSRLAIAVAPDGGIALGGYGDDRVLLLDADARPALQFCTGVTPLPITPAERGAEATDVIRELAAAIAAAQRPEVPAAFGRLVIAADGAVWVQRERTPAYPDWFGNLYGSTGATFDVFERDGMYRSTWRVPPRARLQAIAGDTVWAWEIGELDEVSLVAYRMER